MGKPEEWKKSCFPVNKYQERIPPGLPFPLPFCSRLPALLLCYPCLAPRMPQHLRQHDIKKYKMSKEALTEEKE